MTIWFANESRLTAYAGVAASAVIHRGASATIDASASLIADPNETFFTSASLSPSASMATKAVGLWSYKDLLPPNSTKLERSLAILTGRLIDIPVLIEDVWRSDDCPSAILPWLAWALSVDFWDANWPDERKRAIILESFSLHRKKGTIYAIDRYLNYADCVLRRTLLPPDTPFSTKNLTSTERQAWLDRFPQLRIFQFRDRGSQYYGAYVGGGYKTVGLFTSDTVGRSLFYPYTTDAAERWGPRAFYWDKGTHYLATGEETKVTWLERTKLVNNEIVYDYNRGLIPGVGNPSFFCDTIGNFKYRIFPTEGVSAARIITVSVSRNQSTEYEELRLRTLYPTLDPIYAFPDYVAEKGTSYLGIHMFAGMRGRWRDPDTKEFKRITGFLLGYVPETTAPLRLYERYYLHDPNRLPEGRRIDQIFAGHFRLGLPPYNAVMSVEVLGHRPRREFARFVYGFVSDGKGSRLKFARTAVQKSMAVRDKILLKTKLHRTISSADGLRSDDGHTSGDLILDL